MRAKIQRFFEISGFEGKGKVLLVRKIILTLIIICGMGMVLMNAGTFNRNYVLERLETHSYEPVQIAAIGRPRRPSWLRRPICGRLGCGCTPWTKPF